MLIIPSVAHSADLGFRSLELGADSIEKHVGHVGRAQIAVELRSVEIGGPNDAGLSTVRETRPDTVEFKQAEAIRKSSRVPNVRTQWPGSANTARSGLKTISVR